MNNLKKNVSIQYVLSQSHRQNGMIKWNKIPTRASILIILTYPKHMKYYIHFVGQT